VPPVDDAFLRARLGRWPELLDRPWSVLDGGLRTLQVRLGDVVARIRVAADHPLGKEAALLRLAHGNIRVPKLIDATDDVLLMEYVAHQELPASRAAGERVGTTAAWLHAQRFPATGFLDERLEIPEPFPSAYDGLREWASGLLAGEAGRKLGDAARRIERLWSDAEADLRAAGDPPVIVHSDFKPANVKWLPAEDDVVVFDWEFTWAGPALYDLGQMFRWGTPEEFEAGFVARYTQAGGTLPDNWRRKAELFDLFNLVAFLRDEQPRPRRERDVLRRIRQTVASG
jgi:hypothetical protein